MRYPINIVVLTPGFAADEADTTAIPSLQQYVRFLNKLYDDIVIQIIAFQYPAHPGKYLWNGIPVFSVGGKNGRLNKLMTWIKVFIILFQIKRKTKIDLIHSFWLTEATLVGLVFHWLTGVPLIATAMGQDVKQSNRYLRIIRFFKTDVVLISSFQYNFINRVKNIKIRDTIPFGIDKSLYNHNSTIRTTDIIGVGSLNSIKNYKKFIEITEKILLIFPALRCKIIGDGNEREVLENLIREKNLFDNLELTGKLPYEKVITEMCNARILLHTSEFEGQALVITEALGAGLYVVCHPVGIAASLVSEKLMTGNTTEELISCILKILQNPEPAYRPEFPYKIEDTCQSYRKIYNS